MTSRPKEGKPLVTIGAMLDRSAEYRPDRIALRARRGDRYYEMTYQALKENAHLLALELRGLGLKKGDRVGLIGENRPEWAVAYFAIQKANLVGVPLDPQLKENEIRHILNESGARAVIAAGSFVHMLSEIKEGLPNLRHIISMENLEAVLRTKVPKSFEIKEESSIDDLALLIYTSGTTGSSKGVMLSHRNIISNVDSIYRFIEVNEYDNFLSVLPLHHTFEATCGFLVPIYNNATITYAPSLKSKEIIETMRETSVTCLLGVPLLFEKFYDGIQRNIKKSPVHKRLFFKIMYRVSSRIQPLAGLIFKGLKERLGMGKIRYIISGGAPLPVKISSFFNGLGIPLLQGYGLTEASPVLTVNPPDRPRNASVGIAIPDVRIAIDQPNEDGIGEVIATGPNIMLGYYRNQQATNEVLREGWLYTGDLGYLDKDGYLYIVGRKKSVIVTAGGKNVYPEEIEEILLRSPYIKETIVLPRLNPKTNQEEVYAIIHPDYERIDELATNAKRNFTEADIEQLIRCEINKQCDSIAEYKRVRSFKIREEEFPKTTTKKIKRHLFEKEIVQV
ncbi:MAG: AMP-binding protein [candidate division WOR-3 bacterium]